MKYNTQTIVEIIDNNRTEFVAGNLISQQSLSKWFDIEQPNYNQQTPQQVGKEFTKYSCKKLTAYTKLNKVLALRGIKLSSRSYGDSYEVSNIKQAESKVKSLNKRSKIHHTASRALSKGIREHGGKWSSLNQSEVF